MDNSIYTKSERTLVSKICISCQKELSIDQFGKRRYRSNKPDGHWIYSRYGECLDCTSKRKAIWRVKNPSYMKEWYINHKEIKTKKNEN